MMRMQFTIGLGIRGRNVEKCSVCGTVLHLYINCVSLKKDKSQCMCTQNAYRFT
jgi:hypothetical protein